MKEEMIFIDIVIPTFNSEEYLQGTLDSVLNQTEGNWNCILIDDGSTDQTASICSKYVKSDSRFTFKDREFNRKKGANSCRNIGLEISESDFIMFVDADDLLEENCILNRTMAIKKSNDFDALIFKTAFINNENKVTGYFPCVKKSHEDLILDFLNHRVQWHTMSPVWSKQFLKRINGWNENYERLQDIELNIRALSSGLRLEFINDVVDSGYRNNGLNKVKNHAALYGFSRILFDYSLKLTVHPDFSEEFKTEAHNHFSESITNIINRYFSMNELDLLWTDFFLKNFRKMDIDMEDYLFVEETLNKYNSDMLLD